MEVLSKIAAILQEAVDSIELIDAGDYAPRKYQIVSALQRQVTQIRTNVGDDPLNSVAPEFPPLVLKKDMDDTIAGLVIDDRENTPSKLIFKTPQEVEADELNALLETLVPDFSYTDNTALRETYSDIEIQAVAKKVGMPVIPEVINLDAIQEIKDFMAKKEAIKKAGELDKVNVNEQQLPEDVNQPTEDTFKEKFDAANEAGKNVKGVKKNAGK